MPQTLKYIQCQDCKRPYPRMMITQDCPECETQKWQPWDPRTETSSADIIDVLEELLEFAFSDDHTHYDDGGMFYYIADAIVLVTQHYANRESYYMEETPNAPV
jgi:primosomal protein N'